MAFGSDSLLLIRTQITFGWMLGSAQCIEYICMLNRWEYDLLSESDPKNCRESPFRMIAQFRPNKSISMSRLGPFGISYPRKIGKKNNLLNENLFTTLDYLSCASSRPAGESLSVNGIIRISALELLISICNYWQKNCSIFAGSAYLLCGDCINEASNGKMPAEYLATGDNNNYTEHAPYDSSRTEHCASQTPTSSSPNTKTKNSGQERHILYYRRIGRIWPHLARKSVCEQCEIAQSQQSVI